MTKESQLEAVCNRKLQAVYRDCLIVKNITYRGFPDRSVFTDKGMFFIEYKKEKGIISEAQARVLFKLRAMGYKVYIIRKLEDLAEVFADF